MKTIYRAATETEALAALDAFARKWDKQYPLISKSWRAHWAQVVPMFAFPHEIRKVMYTTNAIESVNMTLQKASRNHRIFPNDDAVLKVLYLAIQNISKKWTMPIQNWRSALSQFAIEFEIGISRGISPPTPPQIRTCPIKASGSSGHGFAVNPE